MTVEAWLDNRVICNMFFSPLCIQLKCVQRRPKVLDVGQHCTNVIQMFSACWEDAHPDQKHLEIEINCFLNRDKK